jgi:predicted nucleotidyltransferase
MKRNPEMLRKLFIQYSSELREFGILSLFVFGSTARGEATETSDVDLLVDFDDKKSIDLFSFIEINHYLEKIIGTKVDLVTRPALKKQLKAQILRESIRVA